MTFSFHAPAKKSVLIRLFWGFFLLFLLLHPKQTSQAVALGLTICATRLIPSLFPLMVLSVFASHSGVCTAFGQFLCRLTKDRMNLGNAGWGAFLLGTVAGFPLGALTVFELQKRGELSEQQARRLCGICNNTGPAFLIAYVGEGLLGDARIGWMLFACQLLAAFTILLFTHPRLRQKNDSSFHTSTVSPVQNSAHDTDISISACLSDAVKTAALNLVGVCGFVVFFSVFLSSLYTLFQPLFTMTPKLFVLCCGFFELTRGVTIAAELSTPPLTALFCAAFCGWAGLCVHMQVMSFRTNTFSFGHYLLQKMISGVLTACYYLLFAMALPAFFRHLDVFSKIFVSPITVFIPVVLTGIFLLLFPHKGRTRFKSQRDV